MTRSAMTTEPRNGSILIPFADRVVGISQVVRIKGQTG